MLGKVFNTLRDRYQIPESMPLRLPEKCEKSYSRRIVDIGMYDATFATRLRLSLTNLYHQLANYLGLSVNQIAHNAQKIINGVEVIWGQLSGGNRRLTLNKFFYDHKPQHISSSQGVYHFLVRKMSLRLVSNMLDSNKNLKNRYFFIQWMDWVCRPEEWDTMPNGFDNTWGIVKKLGGPSVFTFPICLLCHASTLFFVFVFSLDTSVNYR